MGAVLAFEVARELRRRGSRLPSHLFLSARSAPQRPRRHPPIHDLPEPRFSTALKQQYGTSLEGVPSELLQIVLPVLRADLKVSETHSYAPEPPLACPVTAFASTADPSVHPQDMEAWREHTSRAFALHLIDGDHFFVRSAYADLCRVIGSALVP
jgi:medium-chain acyl-[acyl-carrier-protein] hydrolase